ncbi:phosphatidylglycerophosphatase A [Candidatus Falkowbacteria bacterium]|nr:MAG: phosphatidylglycerophosphatase A [Candidatus Falkowbacteria bacterium]
MLHILKGFFALIALYITSFFFLGFIPSFISKKAGSGGRLMGSLIGLGLLIYIFTNNQSVELVVTLIIITFLLGIFLIGPAERIFFLIFGHRKKYIGKINYDHTIIDKVHGQLIAGLPVFFIVADHWLKSIMFFIISWFAFQDFYISKPWLIKKIENKYQGRRGYKGSFGIMIDDTVAGILAAVLTSLYIIVFNFFV